VRWPPQRPLIGSPGDLRLAGITMLSDTRGL